MEGANSGNNKIVARFAPSPTGFLHVGGARSALFNYLFARQNGGKLILRIEDTDKERSKKEYEKEIFESFEWLNLKFDEVYKQSEREDIYKKYLKKMVDDGKAYVSKEEVKEEGQRGEVIRFKNPNKKIKFQDLIRGEIEFDTTELKDFVIAKSFEEPLYHLAVVVDDFEMGISHVIRGEDHISNTPRQILLQEAIGAQRPIYAHLPLILAPDRSKLSKRKHGETVSVLYYRNRGYIPGAMNNFFALLGWNPGTDQEIFSMDELIEKFSIEKIQKGGAVFNVEKLNWLNKEYIKKLPKDTLERCIRDHISENVKALPTFSDETLKKLAPIITDRISAFGDIKDMSDELIYYFNKPEYDSKLLVWKTDNPENTKKYLQSVLSLIESISNSAFDQKSIKEIIWPLADEKGRGNVLWPMRFALSGKEKSPDPFTLAEILGKQETISRLQIALSKL